jgi:uncharacterized protein DUF1707/2TM domain-containing protein
VSPDLRAGDVDRERTVAALREHAGAGRLEVDELAERTEAALRARTLAELDALLGDLPTPRRGSHRHGCGFRAHLRAYVLVISGLVLLWAVSGAGDPWPIWPAFGWGIGLAAHAQARAARRRAPRLVSYGGPFSPS